MTRPTRREAEFEAFFLEHYGRIARSVGYVCGDAERANDATQEAFIRAYARWGSVRRLDNPGAWIRRIAINASRDAYRAETRRSRRERRASGADHDPTPAIDDTAGDILALLPDRQRAVAALYYVDDLTTVEIGEILDIAEGTVRFHLSEARARLREHLSDQPRDDHAFG